MSAVPPGAGAESPAGGATQPRADEAGTPFSLPALLRYFLVLGTIGFGGPIALAGYMERDLVEKRRWISPEDYKEGLAFAQLAPGPLAAQLAMYLGYVRARVPGATLVGLAFIGPSFLMVLALSALYLAYGGLPWMGAVFYGVGAAVIAIIARSAFKLVRLTARRDPLLWSVVAVNALVTAWAQAELVWVFVLSGVFVLLVRSVRLRRSRPAAAGLPAVVPVWLLSGLHGVADAPLLGRILWFFAKAGSVVFGSGLAVVPFLYGGVVRDFHWLTERQFLDAVAVSMITPGPVVITVAFVGYLVAGPIGATVAAIGVFAPVYLFVVAVSPFFRRFAANPRVRAFVHGLTAAATGAIVGAVVVLGRRALVDVATVLICAGVLLVLLRAKKIPEPVLVVAAGLVGLVLMS
ncbi:MAG TPA: chromate transporter [Longimicrobiales bacterium]